MTDISLTPAARRREREVISVAQLNRRARRLLESGLGRVWVEGEVSNLARPASGHWYFTLKDDSAQVRCAMFRSRNQTLRSEVRDGIQVVVRGRVSLYEVRGDYQLIVDAMTEAGEGALQRAFEVLRRRLAEEGLFDEQRKKPIPTVPHRIGVITSPSGAVIRDILHVLKRRFAGAPVLIYPVAVQGESAAPQIVSALRLANSRRDCDVLILARGGGSLEDIWPFNEESVARAIAASRLPVISAVGHESDVTISDFVADLRAPTPSAAAELAVPDAAEWLQTLAGLDRRLARALRQHLDQQWGSVEWLSDRLRLNHPGRRIEQLALRLDELNRRLFASRRDCFARARAAVAALLLRLAHAAPRRKLAYYRGALDAAARRLDTALARLVTARRARLAVAERALDAVGPQATHDRGYAIVMLDQRIVADAARLAGGDDVELRFARGRADARITRTKT